MNLDLISNQEENVKIKAFLLQANEQRPDNDKWNLKYMKPMDHVLYANREIEVGGTQHLLDGGSVKKVGVTNFDNSGMLVKGRVVVGTKIAFGVFEGGNADNEQSVKYNYKTIPSYLVNAILVLKQKDELLVELPICDIINNRADESAYSKLNSFVLVEDEAPVEYYIKFPVGVKSTLPNNKKLFVSAMLKGAVTNLKRA